MKLYTDQQVREAIKMAREGIRSEDNIINSLNFIKSPIELPSNEDIRNEIAFQEGEPFNGIFLEGAFWMRDKIQGSNK
jgi:hypothetical protein